MYLPPTHVFTSGMSNTCLCWSWLPSHRASLHSGQYSFSIMHTVGCWVGLRGFGEIPRWFAHPNTVTHLSTGRESRESNSRPNGWGRKPNVLITRLLGHHFHSIPDAGNNNTDTVHYKENLPGNLHAICQFLFIMVALCNRADHYIFILFLLSSSSFFLFFPRLISAVGDWMFTILWHMVWP